jgi:hypothetical protein
VISTEVQDNFSPSPPLCDISPKEEKNPLDLFDGMEKKRSENLKHEKFESN